MNIRLFLMVGLLALCVSPARAALTLTIENSVDYVVGTTNATVGVFISSPIQDDYSEFFLAIDMLPGGTGLPVGITAALPDVVTNRDPVYMSVGLSSIVNTGAGGQDFTIVGMRGDNETAPVAPGLKLFDLTFDIGAGVAPGAYDIQFNVGASEIQDSSFNTIAGVTYVGGALNVVAIPEPSSLGLAGLALTAFAGFRRRRR